MQNEKELSKQEALEMKAAVYYGPGDVRIEDREIPKAGPDDLVVKIDYCGVCGSDVESYHHDTRKPVMVLGHENVGIVYEVGENVTGFRVGDRLLCGPPSYCREGCPACRSGRPNICKNGLAKTAGIGGPDGGYEEYMRIEDPAHKILIKIPDNVDSRDAVLFDVVCVALHGLRRSDFKFGDTVAVSGTGPVGLSAIQLAKAAGAGKVIAVGLRSSKRDIMMAYGADACVFTEECDDLYEEIRKALGNEEGADVTLECAGAKQSLLNCVQSIARPGGQVIMVGCVAEAVPELNFMELLPREIDLISSFVYTEEEIRMYLELLEKKKISFPDMVTDIIGLDDLVEKGLDRKDRTGLIKILCKP